MARGEAVSATRLVLHRPGAASVEIALEASDTIGFMQVGEAFAAVYEGWWLLGTDEGAVAVSDRCPGVDVLLRDTSLNAAAERIADKFVLDVLSRPLLLRGSACRDGVALITHHDFRALRDRNIETPVSGVRAFPGTL